MIKKIIAIVLLISFICSICFANDQSKISLVRTGQSVPFDGVLYDFESNAIIQEELNLYEKTCKIKSEYISKIEQENCSNQTKQIKVGNEATLGLVKVELDSCHKNLLVMEENSKKVMLPIKPENNSTKYWYGFIGIVIGVALGIGTLEASRRLSN